MYIIVYIYILEDNCNRIQKWNITWYNKQTPTYYITNITNKGTVTCHCLILLGYLNRCSAESNLGIQKNAFQKPDSQIKTVSTTHLPSAPQKSSENVSSSVFTLLKSLFGSIWWFPKMGVPQHDQNWWCIMENTNQKWMIWGYPYDLGNLMKPPFKSVLSHHQPAKILKHRMKGLDTQPPQGPWCLTSMRSNTTWSGLKSATEIKP